MKREDHSEDKEEFGSNTRWEVVRSDISDSRSWLARGPVCPLLQSHHIAHTGLMWARHPFEVVRSDASGTFVLISLSGSGETLVDGEWRKLEPGRICLLPAFAQTGIRVRDKARQGNGEWHFAWVRYEESRESSPILNTNSPVIHKGSVEPVNMAIAGLIAEMKTKAPKPAFLHHWVELIHAYVAGAALPFQDDDRLWRIWQAVESDLGRNWKLRDLAEIGHLSEEHLRRLCQKQLGRSPIQQVTYLRMRRAAALLSSTSDKVEAIARDIGYVNPFTFSNAFKRWTGKRPSDYRD
ncbi:MAG: helix-turn-helix transcriptional regulator [Akkermansiaceae bacterium]